MTAIKKVKINKKLIEEIKANLDIHSLFSRYNVQKGKGKNSYFCIFHEDKKPSLVADNQKGWKCLSNINCGYGDQIEFIKRVEKLSFEEAVIKAASLANINTEEKPEKIPPKKTKLPKIINNLEPSHIKYLAKRGITEFTANTYNLKSRGDYILFPQQRNGHVTGHKGINFKNKDMFFEGSDNKSKLWPDYHLEGIKTVILAAGEYDTLYLNQKLLKDNLWTHKAVTNSTGEGNYPQDITRLKEYSEIEKFIIIYDHDEPGIKGADNLAKALQPLGKPIEIKSFPEDKPKGYDISDFFNEGHSIQDLFNLKGKIYQSENKPETEDNKFLKLLKASLINAPDTQRLVIPGGWSLNENGIFAISIEKDGSISETSIAYAPVYISCKYKNIDTDDQMLQITFLDKNRWQNMIVERVQVADTKKIIELAKKGFPVTSLNARYMVKYLTDFEAANKHYLKEQLTVRGFGWKHYAKQDFFVLGNRVIGTDINVFHLPESIGDEKYSKALIPDGTKERWLETIKKLVPYDKLMYTLYAGFVPIIAEIIECPNFINDMWGETSVGKTTSLELAASIYGLPVREQGGLVMPWDATKVSIERLATLFNHLPIFLDDSQTTNDKVISPALYMMG